MGNKKNKVDRSVAQISLDFRPGLIVRFPKWHDLIVHVVYSSRSASGFKGVSFHHGGWHAHLKCQGKDYRRGPFESPEQAAAAYDAMAIKLFGEFAKTNALLERFSAVTGQQSPLLPRIDPLDFSLTGRVE
jgi:hypothetical protein